MSKTTELVAALRCCEHNSCTGCPYAERSSECIGEVMGAAADRIEWILPLPILRHRMLRSSP